MSADLQATETETSRESQLAEDDSRSSTLADQLEDSHGTPGRRNKEETEEEDDDDGEEEEEEPMLKYAKLTGNLASVYRSGDSTSSFMVAGDKMVLGTHNGNIHVIAIPTAQSIRTYRAHQASVTSVSISPTPPPPTIVKAEDGSVAALTPPVPQGRNLVSQKTINASGGRGQARPQAAPVPNTTNNQIYIATSSMDGHVCISSLVNPEDVQLRNFARPVNAVALSPDYKYDRTYISGGLAGSLILTVGGKAGVSTDANTNSAAAAASGWFSSIGLGSNTGQDKILHSGEGSISSIKWSLSGKWVAWVNEEGIKIMRSHLKLGTEDGEDAWKRIAHAARPGRSGWDEMSGVWKARCEWVDERHLESDDASRGISNTISKEVNGRSTAKGRVKVEKLVVGWGDTAWIIHVTPDRSHSTNTSRSTKRLIGNAETVHKLQFRDCIVAGINFYTPTMLAILAYRTRDDEDIPLKAKGKQTTVNGRRQRQNGLAPQLRLVNVSDGEEVEVDELPMSRFETLTAQDYHFGTLHIPAPVTAKVAQDQQKGMLEGMFDAAGGRYATRIFNSSASILSGGSGGRDANGRTYSFASVSGNDVTASPDNKKRSAEAHPYMLEQGLKLFIQSPYDCVLAVKQDISDHLHWLITHEHYEKAWLLVDSHPEAVDIVSGDENSEISQVTSMSRPTGVQQSGTLAEFFADDSSSQATGKSVSRSRNLTVQSEKRKIGDLWIQQLVTAEHWEEAGKVAGRILGTSNRWEHWVWAFAQAGKFDEITPYIPSTTLAPPLPSLVYEVVLQHYIEQDPTRLVQLLEEWDPELFDVTTVVRAIEDKLHSGDVRENSIENGVRGRDWRILLDSLTKLYLASGRMREALRCCIQLQDADRAFALIREEKLLDAVAENVPGFVMLRVDRQQLASAPLDDLEASSSEAVQLLVNEAFRGTVPPHVVIKQLEDEGKEYKPFLFFYLRALWNGNIGRTEESVSRVEANRRVTEGRTLVDDDPDLAVRLFAEYDRPLLLDFLQTSALYSFDKAKAICQQRRYFPELVHILSKIGSTREALWLIIDELEDVKAAIQFAKENRDLWEDLLNYSMDKPKFIRGLLEEVGAVTAFKPIELVRRIPEGLEIEGLKQGIQRLVREFEVQLSISGGVAKVLRGEVNMGMDTLRAGRRKAVRFEVLHESGDDVDLMVHDVPTKPPEGEALPVPKNKAEKETAGKAKPGRCVKCGETFHEHVKETLVGFACGHVYHLSCLLAADPETRNTPAADELMKQFNSSSSPEDDSYLLGGRPTVGGKVTNAHIIKNVLRHGCQHCIVPEGA